jgi:hypothetical protein
VKIVSHTFQQGRFDDFIQTSLLDKSRVAKKLVHCTFPNKRYVRTILSNGDLTKTAAAASSEKCTTSKVIGYCINLLPACQLDWLGFCRISPR